MLEYGIPNGATAMARTVGIPCGIATQLILDGELLSSSGRLAVTSTFAVHARHLYPPSRVRRDSNPARNRGRVSGGLSRRGVLAPLTPDIYEPIITLLEAEGLSCKEEILA